MEYIGIYTSQNVQKMFDKLNLKSLYATTTKDGLMVRYGYKFENGFHVIELIAICLENSTTHDSFQVFEMENFMVISFDEMQPLVIEIANKIIAYNKDICKFYKSI